MKNKDLLNKDEASKQLDQWLKTDYWTIFAEFQYKYVDRKIVIEEYLGDEVTAYKFYCFNGVPKVMYVSSPGPDGEQDLYLDYYDMDGNWLDYSLGDHEHVSAENRLSKPACWTKMIHVCNQIAAAFPFVRVDLYDVNGDVYLSELTFMPTGGYMQLKPDTLQETWGSWLRI